MIGICYQRGNDRGQVDVNEKLMRSIELADSVQVIYTYSTWRQEFSPDAPSDDGISQSIETDT